MSSATTSVPLLVWGGGSGGVAAALQAARSGVQTLLLTPGHWLGGMISAAGVCAPDGNELTPWQTGLWGALLRALAVAEPTGLDHNWVSCFGFRPATAESVLRGWVASAPNLQWLAGCELLALERRGARVHSVTVERAGGPLTVLPQLVIDGSDLGDLLAHGAADFRLGWESQETWNEPSAPPQSRLQQEVFFERQPVQSPTWVVFGQVLPGQLDGLSDQPLGPPFGGATGRFGLARTLSYGRLPGDLLMLNWPLHGNDWHDDLPGLFRGSSQQQRHHLAQLAPRMQAHSLAFAAALEEASAGTLQLAALFPAQPDRLDQLQGPSPLAPMPYWREGRRLRGLKTVVEQDLLPLGAGAMRAALPDDGQRSTSIAVGNYANDHHYPGGDWPLAAKSCRWGGRWSGTPFCIPYGALLSDGTENLLAADKCLSVSHMANGATRLQPLVLNIGQAAGLAAALCLQRGVAPAELPVEQLQRALIDEPTAPAGPFPLWDTPWHHPHWRERQRTCLQHPEALDAAGRLDGQPPGSSTPPAEPHERLFSGVFGGDAQEGYVLDTAEGRWPLITLEPELAAQLAHWPAGSTLQAIGCSNPWGPWLRLSRLLPDRAPQR
jgi:hypothetical protein